MPRGQAEALRLTATDSIASVVMNGKRMPGARSIAPIRWDKPLALVRPLSEGRFAVVMEVTLAATNWPWR